MKYIIIGNGVAGTEAALKIRQTDEIAEIQILSASKYLFYFRPRLIDYVAGEVTLEKITRYSEDFYKKKNIQVFLNSKVVEIRREEKQVLTKKGEVFDYDRLLIATGARPFIPETEGVHQKGVFSIREAEDVESLQSYLQDKEQVVMIGGGVLGLEMAHSLVKIHKKVTVLEYMPTLLPRQLDEAGGGVLQDILETKGLEFVLDARVQEIIGKNGQVEGVLLANGQKIAADAVVYSAGVRSRTELGKAADLQMDRNSHLFYHCYISLFLLLLLRHIESSKRWGVKRIYQYRTMAF